MEPLTLHDIYHKVRPGSRSSGLKTYPTEADAREVARRLLTGMRDHARHTLDILSRQDPVAVSGWLELERRRLRHSEIGLSLLPN